MPRLLIEEGRCINCGAEGSGYIDETISYVRCWRCGLPYEIKVVRRDGKLVVAEGEPATPERERPPER